MAGEHADEPTPSVIAEKYLVERVLGRGGMGVVYQATHKFTGRPVAVKVLLPEYARETAIVQRFMNEARAAALLRSENVVDVLDMGTDVDGTMYLALELLDGESLAHRLDAAPKLAPDECARWLLPVMDALAAAHAAGIVHRDVKPDNVFLHRAGMGRTVPKLLDFGIAKFRESSQRRTTTGTVLGTVLYMSPEQAHGDSDVGPPSDVWAMGVVWYQCLAGVVPFEGNSVPATLFAITQGKRSPLAERAPTVPAGVVAAVERALAVDKAARWPDMRAFAGAIRTALGANPGLDATAPAIAAVPRTSTAPIEPALAATGVASAVGVPTAEPWVRERGERSRAPSRALAVVAAMVVVAGAVGVALSGRGESGQGATGPATRAAVQAPTGSAAPAMDPPHDGGTPQVGRAASGPTAPAPAVAMAATDAGVGERSGRSRRHSSRRGRERDDANGIARSW